MSSETHHLHCTLLLLILTFPYTCLSSTTTSSNKTHLTCSNFECGNGINISYPFWNLEEARGRPEYCGYPGLGVSCYNNSPTLRLSNNHLYYVKSIDHNQSSLTLVDTDVAGQSYCPRVRYNVTLGTISVGFDFGLDNTMLTFLSNCSSYPSSASPLWCLGNATKCSFVFVEGEIPEFDRYRNCEETVQFPVSSAAVKNLTCSSLRGIVGEGFRLRWRSPANCSTCEAANGFCRYNTTSESFFCLCPGGQLTRNGRCYGDHDKILNSLSIKWASIIFPVMFTVGGMNLMAIIFYCVYKKEIIFSSENPILFWKKRTRNTNNVEEFLKIYGSLGPKRYKYSDVKKITNAFEEKLGQGGYGVVFKGKLNDGRVVAVKVLNESKGNGEEFLNEVATMGRTNHVNIVCLLGFCYEGPKRALIYEFMPNGSLEKFIYTKKPFMKTNNSFGWEKLYQIALGIARGLEYLHRGCSTRILHFDIKPHNILLDQAFCPRISDFGLAKLCPTKEGVLSIRGARGTAGYIAPEFCFRNLGRVSYKSDVYSYGMLVLEMVGGRKNIDDSVENSSGIFFPNWIYKRLEQQDYMGLRNFEGVADEEMAKKMILVGLWCIQIDYILRPSMSRVVEMLEGSMEDLQMPPLPSFDFISNSKS